MYKIQTSITTLREGGGGGGGGVAGGGWTNAFICFQPARALECCRAFGSIAPTPYGGGEGWAVGWVKPCKSIS